jgi:hypothetical protein
MYSKLSANLWISPVSTIMTDMLNGGSVANGCMGLVGDAKLSDHVLELVKDGSLKGKTTQLLGNASFRGQVAGLLGNETFLDQLTVSLGQGNFLSQCGALGSNKDFLNGCFSLLGNADLMAQIGAEFGGNIDIAGQLTGILNSPKLLKLVTSLSGGSEYGSKINLLLGNADIMGSITGLLTGNGCFATGLTDLLTKGSFLTNVCGTLGLDASIVAKLTSLFGSANFGASLEAMLGGSFSGLAGLIGGGNLSAVLTGCFGLDSFVQLTTSFFAGGEIFASIGGLLKDGGFVGTLVGSISGLCSGGLDLSGLIKQLSGKTAFLGQICGLFNFDISSLTKFMSICQKGFGGIGGLGGIFSLLPFKGLFGGY